VHIRLSEGYYYKEFGNKSLIKSHQKTNQIPKMDIVIGPNTQEQN